MKRKKLMFLGLTGLALLGSLVGCSGDLADPALVSQNRVNGKDIAQLNAAEYARSNFPGANVFVAGDVDSFVSATCPQGDGYASFKVKDGKSGKLVASLQCRTWELTGCFTEKESSGKGTYMKNQCNKDNVPETIVKAR